MYLSELVKMRGFDITSKIKLVRHQESSYDIKALYKQNFLEFYQSIQGKDVFGNCDYILSFIGTEGSRAIYIGAYRKLDTLKFNKKVAPQNFPYKDMFERALYHYKLEKIDLLEDMVDRLIIDWGKSTRSWYQWLDENKDKQIIEILPKGYVKEFSGFDELILSYDELSTIIKNPDANRVWHTMLASVAGIYLIVDMTDGSQYIGSAYGKDGMLGRWNQYVKIPHGGNEKLIKLLEDEHERYKNFQFSILRTLPKSMTNVQVIAHEQKYKKKLGTRAFGLNTN